MEEKKTVAIPVEYLGTIVALCQDVENVYGEFAPPSDDPWLEDVRALGEWLNSLKADIEPFTRAKRY